MKNRYYSCFTLLEVLIVISILAVLASVSFIAINPYEQIKKSRDSRRLFDLRSLDTAIGIYESQVLNSSTGSSTKIYLSLADSSSDCSSYSLPPAPVGYTYSCVSNDNLYRTDGYGWVPINFNGLPSGSPISKLPIDPLNNQQYYYTYVTGGSHQLTSLLESIDNNVSVHAVNDGGWMPGVFEVGNDLSLGPFTRDNGLVGYWTLDEGSGTVINDYSGQGNNGSKSNGSWESEPTCANSNCLGTAINGLMDTVTINDPTSGVLDFSDSESFSVSFWIETGAHEFVYSYWLNKGGSAAIAGYSVYINNVGVAVFSYADGNGSGTDFVQTTTNLIDSGKHMITFVVDREVNKIFAYTNGILEGTDVSIAEGSAKDSTSSLKFGETNTASSEAVGVVDDLRIYNRALTAEEIKAIYNFAN